MLPLPAFSNQRRFSSTITKKSRQEESQQKKSNNDEKMEMTGDLVQDLEANESYI